MMLLSSVTVTTEIDEDFALAKAIEAGLLSESVSREELDSILYAD